MTQKFRPIDYDIIYLSYDEPNAEENYANLCSKVPWAKRVHGVEGSDAAHKACAKLSETERFITIDGDNKIRDGFLDQEIDIEDFQVLKSSVISWCGQNVINGLIYGNGGIKCWPTEYVLNMRTHENADPHNKQAQVEFCWDANYIQQKSCFSDVYNNANPQQAWRAGFREGVKMVLDRGNKVADAEALRNSHWKNLHRLYIWSMIGADVENGEWAILGARAGLYKTMCTDWNYINVRDFEYLNNLWNEEFADFEGHEVYDESCRYTKLIVDELDIPIADPLMPGQSKFFKTVYNISSRNSNKLIDIEEGANR